MVALIIRLTKALRESTTQATHNPTKPACKSGKASGAARIDPVFHHLVHGLTSHDGPFASTVPSGGS